MRTAAAVSPRTRIINSIARGRFGSNLLTATHRNKPPKHKLSMSNKVRILLDMHLRHFVKTLLLFNRLRSAFAHEEVLEDKHTLLTLGSWSWGTADATRRPLIGTALDFDDMIDRFAFRAGG